MVTCLTSVVLAAPANDARITSSYNELKEDGSFSSKYEASDDTFVQQAGVGGVAFVGASRYYTEDGTPIQITFIADQDGYRPTGDHLPTPPPTPDYILRSLEYLKKHAPKDRPDEILSRRTSE